MNLNQGPNKRSKISNRMLTLALCVLLFTASALTTAIANDTFIVVQSTTSTQNSGLFDHILPMFSDKTGIDVRVVAVGTGQAIKNARNGDGDVLFVHAKSAEEKFVVNGDGVRRHNVMYNDFVIVGPGDDPAQITGINDITLALTKLAQAQALFASRGDDSGTHKKELSLWTLTGIDAGKHSGTWYRETGSGMGATLNVAVAMGAYTMTDRATWISFQNKERFRIHVEGDPRLFNQYGITLVNPQKHPHVKARLARQFINWLLSDEAQQAIAGYRRDGRQLFFPNAGS